jgi:predicted RNase H-like nuclease (RuvC/YqgF family)
MKNTLKGLPENVAKEVVRHIQYGHDQQLRAEEAEAASQRKDEELRALRRDIARLEKTIEGLEQQLDEKQENDVFNDALSENNTLLKEMNWKLTQRCAKHLKDIQKLETELTSLQGQLKMSNYLIRLMKMITVARGIRVEEDPVFIMSINHMCQSMSMEEVDQFQEAMKRN